MQSVAKDSIPAANTGLAVYDVPETQVTIVNQALHKFSPISPIADSTTFTFELGSSQLWTDLSSCYLRLVMQLSNPDGTGVGQKKDADGNVIEQKTTVVNYPLFSIFQSIRLFINNNLVDHSTEAGYTAVLSAMLNSSSEERDAWYKAAGFYKMGVNEKTSSATSFSSLSSKTKDKQKAEFLGRFENGLFDCGKLFPGYCSIRIELQLKSQDFCLLNYTPDHPVTMKILEVEILARKCQIIDSVALQLTNSLRTKPYVYPYNKLVTRTLFVNEGVRSAPKAQLFKGLLPTRVWVAFVPANSFHGVVDSQPFMFQPHNVEQISLHAGDEFYPRESLSETFNFEKGQYATAFLRLWETMGMVRSGSGFGEIGYEQFATHATIFAFNLCPTNATEKQLSRYGDVSLSVRFGNETPKNGLMAVVMAEFQTEMYLNEDFNAVMEMPA